MRRSTLSRALRCLGWAAAAVLPVAAAFSTMPTKRAVKPGQRAERPPGPESLSAKPASLPAYFSPPDQKARNEPPLPPHREGLAPIKLVRIPDVVILVGTGRINEEVMLRRIASASAPITLSAEQGGVVDYIHEVDDVVCAGDHLLRLYDPSLLTDLETAARAAALIGSRPFVIAPPPLVPPPAAPPPRPNQASLAPPTSLAPTPRLDLHIDLSPPEPEATGAGAPDVKAAQPQRAAPSIAVQAPAAQKAAEGFQAANAADMGATRRRLAQAEAAVASAQAAVRDAEAYLREKEQELRACEEDLDARHKLFEAGVLAARELDPARAAVSDAHKELQSARAGADRTRAARRDAIERRGLAQQELVRAESASRAGPPVLGTGAPPPSARRVNAATETKTSAQRAQPAAAGTPRPLPEPPLLELNTSRPSARQSTGFPAPMTGEAPAPTRPARALHTSGELPPASWTTPLPPPPGAERLAEPRWHDQFAPGDSVVSEIMAARGSIVEQGAALLKLRETGVVRLFAEVSDEKLPEVEPGTPIRVLFPHAPDVRLDGWIVSTKLGTRPAAPRRALVEFLLSGPGCWGMDAYQTLLWLALFGPLPEERGLSPLGDPWAEAADSAPDVVTTLFGFPPVAEPDQQTTAPSPQPGAAALSGTVGLALLPPPSAEAGAEERARAARAQKTLALLRAWRCSFIEGMQTTVFPGTSLTLTYPRDGEIACAVERMATARVPHAPRRCAGTLAYALGWGLGDAATWARRLPERGYVERPDRLARPGDIVVWEFSFGPGGSQHIGIAVRQGNRIMLLSNLGGRLCTVPLQGGYHAFYKPQ